VSALVDVGVVEEPLAFVSREQFSWEESKLLLRETLASM